MSQFVFHPCNIRVSSVQHRGEDRGAAEPTWGPALVTSGNLH